MPNSHVTIRRVTVTRINSTYFVVVFVPFPPGFGNCKYCSHAAVLLLLFFRFFFFFFNGRRFLLKSHIVCGP